MSRSTGFLALWMVVVGCDLEDETWEPVAQVDDGVVCVEGDADANATVHVDAGVCLSSSCDRDATGSCTATLDGATITVTSEFTWETQTGDATCTADCGLLTTTCEVGPLPAGSYTIEHGTESRAVTIPSAEDCNTL